MVSINTCKTNSNHITDTPKSHLHIVYIYVLSTRVPGWKLPGVTTVWAPLLQQFGDVLVFCCSYLLKFNWNYTFIDP